MKHSDGGTGVAGLLTSINPDLPLPLHDEGIRYTSQGTVLLIGPAALIVPAAMQLAEATRVVACSIDRLPSSSARANPLFIPCRVLAVHGHLGNFRVVAQDPAQNPLALSLFSPKSDGSFDLVLDLSPTPLLSAPIKPPGYFAPLPANVDDAVAQLLALKGSFRKARFFRYDAGLCAHGAQGIEGCTRCLSVCPADAISSAGERIEVNAHLCQGCSSCMLVCPSGALSHAQKAPDVLIQEISGLAPAGGRLYIHQDGEPSTHEPAAACLSVPAVAVAGPEIWFSALALGFAQVRIELPDDLAERTRLAIDAQLAFAHSLLAALGQPAWRIVSSDIPVPPIDARNTAFVLQPAYVGKREQLLWALEILQGASAVDGFVGLPADAAMGGVGVDSERCTRCLACTQLCPTSALIGESGQTVLDFIEGRCVQCHICERACPEHAIVTESRFLLDAEKRRTPTPLHEDQQHHCPQCGVAFISKALLARGIEIMRERGGCDDERIENLRLCPVCRGHRLHDERG